MMSMTVDQAADATGVTPKQVRVWIRNHGCPVVQEGAKGTGNGALIDAARFPAWHAKHTGRPLRVSMAGFFMEEHPGRNPLREMHDVHRRGFLWVLGSALDDWANRPEKNGLDYRPDGLSLRQARAIAFKVWTLTAMTAAAYQTDRLDRDIENELDGDLDAWLSLMTLGDFRTRWQEPEFGFPPKIVALAPRELRKKIEALGK